MAGQVVGTAILELLGDSAQFRAEMLRAGRQFENIGRRMESAGRTLTAAVTLPIIGIAVAAGKAAVDFESSFAGIRKTMDLTETQFQALASANRTLAKEIPVSVNELNRIGELAGQLGIRGVDNVLKFERTIADLAVTTDLTADAAALAFAQIANVLQLPQDQIDRLGSAVAGLGNNFATVESKIVDFVQRIAGAGKIAGLSAGDVAGIGAAFASLGIEAEAGGTAVQRVLLEMVAAVSQGGESLEVFARTSGVTAQEFARAFREDAGATFAGFVEGMGRQGDRAIGTLDALGLADARLARAFLGAAGAGDILTRAITQGNAEFNKNTALAEEAAKRYETAASKLKVFWNQLVDVSITLGNAFIPILTDALEVLRPLVEATGRVAEAFARLPRPIRLVTVAVFGLAAAVGPALIVVGKLAQVFALVKAGAAVAALAFTPVTLALAAVAAAVVAGIYVWRRWGDDIKRIAALTVAAVADMVGRIRTWLVDRFNAIVDGVRASIEKIRDAWAWLKDTLVGNSIIIEMVDSIAEQFRRIGPEVVRPLERQTQEIAASFEQLGEQMERIALSGIDAFAEFATGSGNAIRRFVNQAIADLARLAVRLAVIEALQFIFPGSGFVAGLAGLAGIGERASGGPVLANRPYVVGERGPELFVPQSAGQVVAAGTAVTVRWNTPLPAPPALMSPEAVAVNDWWRRAFSNLVVDWNDRGGQLPKK